MRFKLIPAIGVLIILWTPAGVFAQDDLAALRHLRISRSAQIRQDILINSKDILNTEKEIKFLPTDKETKTNNFLRELQKFAPEKHMKSGGVDTGGGTIIKTSQGVGLLDLYLYNKAAFSDSRMNHNVLEQRSLKNLGVDLITNSKQPIFQKTLAQIDKWRASSPILTQYLRLALRNLRLYFHQGAFVTSPLGYYLPDHSNVDSSDLKMIAIYIKGFGVHVGLDDFTKLPETHQIALLIHEGLRAMSIEGDFNYSNETIQRLTATLLEEPTPRKSLDQDYFLAGEVLSSLQEYAVLIQEVQYLKREACTGRYDINYVACEIQEKDCTPEGAYQIAYEIFSKLYLLPKSEKTIHLLNRAYLAVMRLENASLRDTLSKAHLVTLPSYLTMLLDSYIAIENDEGLPSQTAADVKSGLRSYFHLIGVDVSYSSQSDR